MIHLNTKQLDFFGCSDKLSPYDQRQVVDTAQEYSRFSFLIHFPEQEREIADLMKTSSTDGMGRVVTLEKLLENTHSDPGDLTLLKKMGFLQLNSEPEFGIALEHPNFPGWLIKKNYTFTTDQEKKI